MSFYKEMDFATFDYYLNILGERIENCGESFDIVIYGGFALIAYYDSPRTMTRDADIGFMYEVIDPDTTSVIQEAEAMADEYDLDYAWFNADQYQHINDRIRASCTLEETYGGINVYVPSAEALLALKVTACRVAEGESNDGIDIQHLISYTGIEADADTLYELALQFCPDEIRDEWNYKNGIRYAKLQAFLERYYG